MIEFVFNRMENILGKGENAGNLSESLKLEIMQ